MKILQTDDFHPLSLHDGETLQLIDVFHVHGKKTIQLHPHSSLTYLVVGSDVDIDIVIETAGPFCSCTVFGLFMAAADHPVTGSLKISLNHPHTSANVEMISFLYDGAKISVDGSIAISKYLHHVHGRLLERSIILGKNTSITTLPKLTVASYDVTAAHGASIDTLDQQKLFYMMSRGLSQQQSQTLLVDGYIDYVLQHFPQSSDLEKQIISTILKH